MGGGPPSPHAGGLRALRSRPCLAVVASAANVRRAGDAASATTTRHGTSGERVQLRRSEAGWGLNGRRAPGAQAFRATRRRRARRRNAAASASSTVPALRARVQPRRKRQISPAPLLGTVQPFPAGRAIARQAQAPEPGWPPSLPPPPGLLRCGGSPQRLLRAPASVSREGEPSQRSKGRRIGW